MRNYEKIFKGLPIYVGDDWWQEHFAKKFEGTMKGSYYGIYKEGLRTLAEGMKEGLERATAEAVDYIRSVNDEKTEIEKTFEICSNLSSELCPHIDIVRIQLNYYIYEEGFGKWAVEIIGGSSKIGYQGSYPLLGSQNKEVIKDFLASDEFVIASMHQLVECDEQMMRCEMDVRSW